MTMAGRKLFSENQKGCLEAVWEPYDPEPRAPPDGASPPRPGCRKAVYHHMEGRLTTGATSDQPGQDWHWLRQGGLESGGKDNSKQMNELLFRAL